MYNKLFISPIVCFHSVDKIKLALIRLFLWEGQCNASYLVSITLQK